MGCIKKAQRKRILNTTLSYLEDAQYKIDSANEGEIIIRSKLEGDNRKLHLFLHSQKRKIKDFKHEINKLLYCKDYVANIFYKDGENFHVRLGERADFKGDSRSLKKYTNEDLNRALHLRGLEKYILGISNPQKILTYYQPETVRLPEGFRSYSMEDIILDYSHIPNSDVKFNFVREKVSEDYKIAKELSGTRKNIGFSPTKKGSTILVINSPRYNAGKK